MLVNHIRTVAERQGFSPPRLARRADLSEKAMYTIWRGERIDLRVTTLLKVAAVLGVDPLSLVEVVEAVDAAA